MITIGVDAHKHVHAAVAIDDAGKEVGQWRGANTVDGWCQLLAWASAYATPRQWGIEGAWGYGRGLAQHLIVAGESVFEVCPRWTAAQRRTARRPGKTDRVDARAVARFVRQEAPDLPAVTLDDASAVLDLLTTEREATIRESTRLRNQLHALLLQLDPDYRDHLPAFDTPDLLDALDTYTTLQPDVLQQERAGSVRRLAQRLRLAVAQAADLEQQIADRTQEAGFTPLTELCGISLLTAGTLAGILGPGHRFATDAELAAHAGVAPLEASSAGTIRHRVNRGGNRRLNGVLYRIAITQLRCYAPAQQYVAESMKRGKTKREAIRALKRYIVRAVWRRWQKCGVAGQETGAAPAAA